MPNRRCHVLTVTYGQRWNLLRQALSAARDQGVCGAVVVANGAQADIPALVEEAFPGFAHVISLPRNTGSAGGFGAALDHALRHNLGEVLILDDDNRLEPGSLQHLQNAYTQLRAQSKAQDGVAVLAYRPDRQADAALGLSSSGMLAEPHTFFGFSLGHLPFKLYRRTPWGRRWLRSRPVLERSRIDLAPYSGLYFHTDVLKRSGLPNAEFLLYADDTDFSHRIAQLGAGIYLVPAAILTDIEPSWNVISKYTSTFDALLQGDNDFRAYYSTRNHAYFEQHCRRSSTVLRGINRWLYLQMLRTRALATGRLDRYQLLLQAIHDGEAGRLGESAHFPLSHPPEARTNRPTTTTSTSHQAEGD